MLVEQEPVLPPAPTLRESLALRGGLEAIADERDRWRAEARLVEFLHRFGLDEAQDPASASGGERKRGALALALALQPDVLLLDEPTNHLDIDGIAQLEQLLLGSDQSALTLIVITHDRAFLDRVATRIVELDRGLLRAYPGNYTAFEGRKEVELAAEAKARATLRQVLGAGRGLDPQGHRGAAHAQRGPRQAPRAPARRTHRAARAARQHQARARCGRALGQAGRRARAA